MTARRRALVGTGLALGAVLAAVVVLATAGRGDDAPAGRAGAQPRPLRPTVEQFVAGRGVRAAVVMRRTDLPRSAPVVVFLHGWTAVDPSGYGAWLGHLVARRATVVFPVYQQPPFVDVQTPLRNARSAIRAALRRIGRHGPLVAVGHSAGGALAADLAATARAARLPIPAAVYAVYPGRSIADFPVRLEGPSLARIPSRTRILALASPADEVVGTTTAREIVAEARRVPPRRRTLRIVRDPAVGDHLAPQRDGPAERRTFWRPLDRLVRLARRQASGSRPSHVPIAP